MYQPTIIFRHRKENKNKCSLKGLENDPRFIFYQYPQDPPQDYQNTILLDLNAPVLSKEDSDKDLFIIDGTWNYAKKMLNSLDQKAFIKRSLPHHIKTAYPRKQTGCSDPERGLASIEAVFTAFFILGKDTKGLLDNYYWKEAFLEKNKDFFLD